MRFKSSLEQGCLLFSFKKIVIWEGFQYPGGELILFGKQGI
jgi:hypothetical protein